MEDNPEYGQTDGPQSCPEMETMILSLALLLDYP